MKIFENGDLKDIVKEGVWVVDFYADWCGPCKMILPILESISNENNIIKVNVDEHQDLASSYGVMSIPTLIYFKDGKEKNRTTGFVSKEAIIENIEKAKSN